MMDLIPYLKNVTGSPKSTIVGLFLMLFACYLIYNNMHNNAMVAMLAGGPLFGVGVVALFLEDYKKPKDEA